MGEKSDAKLMYSIDGKEFKEVGETKELTIDSAKEPLASFTGGEMTFSCGCVPQLQVLEILLGRTRFIRCCQRTKSNNWLRSHGLPMRRKAR